MSVSSGSSLCGDADQDLLIDEEEDIDFYAVLNVPRDVSVFICVLFISVRSY